MVATKSPAAPGLFTYDWKKKWTGFWQASAWLRGHRGQGGEDSSLCSTIVFSSTIGPYCYSGAKPHGCNRGPAEVSIFATVGPEIPRQHACSRLRPRAPTALPRVQSGPPSVKGTGNQYGRIKAKTGCCSCQSGGDVISLWHRQDTSFKVSPLRLWAEAGCSGRKHLSPFIALLSQAELRFASKSGYWPL